MKIIQIAVTDRRLYALTDDGHIWMRALGTEDEWHEIKGPTPPGSIPGGVTLSSVENSGVSGTAPEQGAVETHAEGAADGARASGGCAGDCISCGECGAEADCPRSHRFCGHHCNHSWSHDACCWCGAEWGEDDAEKPGAVRAEGAASAGEGLAIEGAPPCHECGAPATRDIGTPDGSTCERCYWSDMPGGKAPGEGLCSATTQLNHETGARGRCSLPAGHAEPHRHVLVGQSYIEWAHGEELATRTTPSKD